MAKTDTTTLFPEIQNVFDNGAFRDGWKTWASFGSRLSDLTLGAAAKSTDLATEASKETIANLRDITTVRDDVSDYAKACNGFVQAQAELTRRTTEAFFGIVQQAGTEASELVSDAGETATAKARDAAGTVASTAKKAA